LVRVRRGAKDDTDRSKSVSSLYRFGTTSLPAVTDQFDRLSAALAGRYRLERKLGAGGMATVYLAEDIKHHRRVAIKVLRPELAAAIGPERFLREIETTAALHHPHILSLYDSGRAGDSTGVADTTPGHGRGMPRPYIYYVMPYVEGESLRQRLDRERQLPVDDALRIAREVADALSYAHQRGIVHRDIKPENILLESGHAIVADFGIARAVSSAGGDRLTETGMSVGTPSYMSPEQAAGERDIDGRSDLYALGCVLYEMLAGQAPFTGPTAESVVRQHMAVDAPPVTNLRPAVPAVVASALQRALAKAPADRFNPVAQFAEALAPNASAEVQLGPGEIASASQRRIGWIPIAVSVGVVLLIASAYAVWPRDGDEATSSSIAVLRFADLSSDQSLAYLGEGMAETLINALSNVPGLDVAARTSAFSIRGAGNDVRDIGRQLGVATVLEGSVQRAGERLRVTAQLVKTSNGLQLWSQRFDRDLSDIFAVQDEVAGAVVTALQGRVRIDAAPGGTGTTDPAAYEAYLQGRFFWNKRAVPDLKLAIEYFEEAIAHDSAFARAWAGLADTYLVLPFYSDTISTGEVVPLARRAAERALALTPDLVEARTTLAYALAMYDWDWAASEREFRRAIELDPNYATAHKWYSDMLSAMGRFDESLAEAERAAELDPRSPNARTIVGLAHYFLGHDEQAELEFQRALELDPTFPLTLRHVSQVYWVRGDTARFFAIRERQDAVSERGEVSAPQLRRAYAAGGPDSVLRLQVNSPGARRNPMDRARWNTLLGDLDAAFLDLEQAARERNIWLPLETKYPYLATLRADPRYDELMKRMGLR